VKFVEVLAEFPLVILDRPADGPFVSPVAVDLVGRCHALDGRLSLEANGIVAEVGHPSFLFVDSVKVRSVEFIGVDVAVLEDSCRKCFGEGGRTNGGDSCVPGFLQFASKSASEFDSFGYLGIGDPFSPDQGHFPSSPSPSPLLSKLLVSPLLPSKSPKLSLMLNLLFFDS
jgi:hypothetical protein